MDEWGSGRAAEATAIVDAALADEALTEDEVAACLWDEDDAGLVLGADQGDGVAAIVVHDVGTTKVGFLKLLAVRPEAQRRGIGRELLVAAQDWAFAEGAAAVVPGGSAPYYLWPGVDFQHTAALCLFERLGYRPRGAEFNMRYPVSHRAAAPAGVEVRRAMTDADAERALAFCARHWPNWVAELRRSCEYATAFIAVDDAGVVGFCCHSVNRIGWLGPMATDPTRRHGGVGNALLGAIAQDLMAAGRRDVEVAWVGPAGFYANAAGATVSRVFRTVTLPRPA